MSVCLCLHEREVRLTGQKDKKKAVQLLEKRKRKGKQKYTHTSAATPKRNSFYRC